MSSMSGDEPTVPNLDWDGPGAAPDRGASANTPTWPPSPVQLPRAPGPDRSPQGSVSALLLGVSLGANVVLLMGLLGLLLLNHAGLLAPGGSAGPSVPAAAQSSPTESPSPTPLSGWLQVLPSSVQLGCDGDQRTQVVILANGGPQKVRWQAVLTGSADQAGVAVDPTQGDLDARASVSVKIANTTRSSGSQGGASQQGVIRFTPTSADAGSPPTLSYTAEGC